jgi:hypothetical protein
VAIGTTLVGLAIGWWQAAAAMLGHALLLWLAIRLLAALRLVAIMSAPLAPARNK